MLRQFLQTFFLQSRSSIRPRSLLERTDPVDVTSKATTIGFKSAAEVHLQLFVDILLIVQRWLDAPWWRPEALAFAPPVMSDDTGVGAETFGGPTPESLPLRTRRPLTTVRIRDATC